MRKLIALILTTVTVGIVYAQGQREPGNTFCPKVAERLAGGDAAKKQTLIEACMDTERFLLDQGNLPKGFRWDFCQNEAESGKARQALMKIVLKN
ncbi:MAG: hypothetical protein HY924_13005 [Elusimicrobia bacterium]|nr:hypothetical protein [Elusimicrobiota bacterium]